MEVKDNEAKIEKLKEWLKSSKHTVVLTGAGMSTESGIADFRSQDGLWTQVNPMELASIKAMKYWQTGKSVD